MSSSRSLHRNLALAAVGSFLVGASSVHCGSGASSSNGFTGTGAGSSTGTAAGGAGVGGTNPTGSSNGGSTGTLMLSDASGLDYSLDSFYVNDPPPTTCDGGGMAPPPPGGSPSCPDDKNLPGCPCAPAGTTAACWTGLRADREHGDCMDGMTTCMQSGETTLTWGPCNGEVLPVPGATGKAACECFSAGHWNIANLSPCFYTDSTGSGAISTIGATMMCPSDFTMAPSQSWSTDTLTVDCAGSFNLCYTIKAGNGKSPQASDCTVAQVCSSSYYTTAGVTQTWPDLPGWISSASASACVTQFTTTGGYGQMSVAGQSSECETIPEKVFQTVTYCPLSCNMPNPPASCAQCSAGGGGTF